MQVEDNLAQTEKQAEDHQGNKFHDMHISGSWSDAMAYLDYIREDHMNPNVAQDLEILQSFWKGKDVSTSVPQVYADEERRGTSLNYLKNRFVAME